MFAAAASLTFSFSLALAVTPLTPPSVAIEQQERVELGAVSIDGHLGRTSVELARLTSSTSTAALLPALLELAQSTSPVARVAAAAGLRDRTEPEAREALARLAKDRTLVKVQRGCLGSQTTVAEAVAYVVEHGVF